MKLVKNRPFNRRVHVKIPAEDGEAYEEVSFLGRFEALTAEESAGFSMANHADRATFLSRVFVGFSGVLGDDDLPLPANAEGIARLIADPFVQSGLVKAYIEAMAGAARKN